MHARLNICSECGLNVCIFHGVGVLDLRDDVTVILASVNLNMLCKWGFELI